ncbi:hypothetical protein GCM10027273_12290 [Nocardioides pakistanensis]
MRGDQIKDALTLGRWRRKRTMMRLLRELDRIDARELHPARRRNTEWPRRLGIGLVALALTTTILGISTHKQFGVRFDRSGITVASPLGKPPPVPGTGGSFAFAATQPDGSAVAYDPCKPIEYVVNDALAPPGSEGLLHSAISEISAATGLVFEYVGASTDVPTQADGVGASDRDPALLAWTTPAEVSLGVSHFGREGAGSVYRTSSQDESGLQLSRSRVSHLERSPVGVSRNDGAIVKTCGWACHATC